MNFGETAVWRRRTGVVVGAQTRFEEGEWLAVSAAIFAALAPYPAARAAVREALERVRGAKSTGE